MKVELNDPSLEKGKELYVNNLGVLVNGKAVDFSAEDIERFGRNLEDAFKDNPNIKVSGAKGGDD